MKRNLGPRDIIFPVPAALVATGTVERPNVLTVAWIGMMGSDPPVLAISLKKGRHSLAAIRKEREFTVNIPSSRLFRETDYCGLVSGRRRQKFQDCGLTPLAALVVKAPLVKECPFNLECKVIHEVGFGDWTVLFGEIVETHVDMDKVDSFTGKIDMARMDPLVYCATVREYWSLGARLGFGFRAGKQLVKKSG
jgi:flavin reductase (DIM6/NTAB) family NADH-FMN oxidoreductase RutF